MIQKEMMKRPAISVLFFFLLVLSSCVGDEKAEGAFADCKYAQPEPIFNKSSDQIEDHRFSLDGQRGVEIVHFSEGVQLKLTQEGCDDLRQIFEFTFPSLDIRDDSPDFWLMLAVAQFDQIADIGADYMVFGSWAAALVRNRDQFEFGESVRIQKGFYVKVDRMKGKKGGILMLTLSQTP